jgi:serine/threonine protein kinase
MKENPHPFIVKVFDNFLDNNRHLCIVEEYFSEGDFYKFLERREKKKFEEKEILQFLANIIMIVYHLNSRDIYHRDLKPANLLIKTHKNGRIYLYLNDFGLAKNKKPD